MAMSDRSGADPDSDDVRTRIVSAAVALLTSGGSEALTTRAVALAAGVQAPTIYRLFGDKHGLLDAVAEHGFAAYMKQKRARKPGRDPVEDLRRGWDLHIEFGLANPAIYAIMIGYPTAGMSPAAAAAAAILDEHIRRIAVAGQLRVSQPRAVALVHAAGSGTVLALLAMPADRRDLGLSKLAREAVIAAITTGTRAVDDPTPGAAAVALRAVLPDATGLSAGERHLLEELLDRLASTAPR